jgi:hypothetical protein
VAAAVQVVQLVQLEVAVTATVQAEVVVQVDPTDQVAAAVQVVQLVQLEVAVTAII